MSESKLMRDIMATFSHGSVRLFRNNVGLAWMGEAKNISEGSVFITNARRVKFGLCDGSSDLIGWRSITITPEMVGKQVAIFTALEVKDGPKKRPNPEQTAFLTTARSAGAIAEIAFSLETAQSAFACKRLFKVWRPIQHLNQDDDEDMLIK